jgi:hypothetical protein
LLEFKLCDGLAPSEGTSSVEGRGCLLVERVCYDLGASLANSRSAGVSNGALRKPTGCAVNCVLRALLRLHLHKAAAAGTPERK